MVNRVITGAHYGFGSWLAQRVTACAMAIYSVLFVIMLIAIRPGDYEAWHGMFVPVWMRLATILFWLSLCYHAWVGVRDIIMDYIKPTAARLVAHGLVIFALIGLAAWSVQILWRA